MKYNSTVTAKRICTLAYSSQRSASYVIRFLHLLRGKQWKNIRTFVVRNVRKKLRGYFLEGGTRRSRIGECILKVALDR